jgi:Holliday junction DNA helicase RuvB
VSLDDEGAFEIARRSRGTARVANRLLKWTLDVAQVNGAARIDREVARSALAALQVDEAGLDEMDTRILRALIEKFGGGPAGLNTLAVAVGEDPGTLEEVHEPFLIQRGFLQRTPRGREATASGYTHLGLKRPGSAGRRSGAQSDLF